MRKILVFCLLVVASCAKSVNNKKPEVTISGFGSDMRKITCHFKPSLETVQQFFQEASPLKPYEEHQKFGWSPCFVEGLWNYRGEWRKFKLRPTGSAQVEIETKDSEEIRSHKTRDSHPQSSRVELFGCQKCVSILQESSQ